MSVRVLTPSLNKSFKFQSNWPFNNSQSYLVQSLITDIKEDEKSEFVKEKDGYKFTSKVNYPNNKKLINQVVIFDKKFNPVSVSVLDKDGNVQIKMSYAKVNNEPKFKDNYFILADNMKTNVESKSEEMVSKIDDIIYPMYLPENTRLESQEKVSKDIGERVILTFSGDKSFMLVEETVSKEEDMLVIPTYGEPIVLHNTVAAVSDNSISWTDGVYDFYVVSDTLEKEELITVAQSLSSVPVMK
ncbi:MAG: outer membrane lipoprotein carrier protein LolA [Bacilli bacterium]